MAIKNKWGPVSGQLDAKITHLVFQFTREMQLLEALNYAHLAQGIFSSIIKGIFEYSPHAKTQYVAHVFVEYWKWPYYFSNSSTHLWSLSVSLAL